MNRMILGWIDEKMDKANADLDNGKTKLAYAKAFGLGALEGVLDLGMVIGVVKIGASIVTKCVKKH